MAGHLSALKGRQLSDIIAYSRPRLIEHCLAADWDLQRNRGLE